MAISRDKYLLARFKDALIYWFYIPIALIGSGLLIDYIAGLSRFPSSLPFIVVAVILIFCGTILIQKATNDLMMYGEGTPNPRVPAKRLVTQGSFSYCRHPMFLGYDLTALGIILLFRSYSLLLICYPAFILLQNRFLRGSEEEILARRFGSEFEEYRRRVPFLLPNPFSKKSL